MGRGLYEGEAVYRSAVDACCEVLSGPLGLDLRTVLYPAAGEEAAAAEALKRTSLTQPALFVTEYALTQLLGEWGIRPVAMVGHSIGELVAACVSGVLERDAALGLVAERGRLMESAPSGVMVSVPLSAADARGYEGEGVWLSVVNAAQASVLSCTHEAVEGLESRLAGDGVAYQRLQTSHAFHCGLMDGVTGPLTAVAGGIETGPVGVPYVSNVTGQWVDAELVGDADYWSRQVREAVRFDAGVETVLSSHGDCVLLEVGPGQALGQLVRGVSREGVAAVVNTLGGAKSAVAAGESLAVALGRLWSVGVEVDWAGASGSERRLKVALPTYPFQRKRYWVEPGRRAEGPVRGVHKREDISQWFYAPSWRPSIVPAPAASPPRRWLVLAAEGAPVADALAAGGAEVIRVVAGAGYACHDEGHYTVSPGSRADIDALLEQLAARQWLPEVVVHALGLADENGAVVDPGAVDEHFFGVLQWVQALAVHAAEQPWRLELLVRGALDAPGGAPASPGRAALAGLCRVIPQELAGVSCRLVDADRQAEDSLAAELLAVPSAPEVAYRGARRWVRGYDPTPLPSTGESGSRIQRGGVCLITGGLGRIGLALARCLAFELGVRLVLTARSGLPERDSWDDPAASWRVDPRLVARVDGVRELEAGGAGVLVAQADVTDEAAMRAAVAEAERRFGPITAIVHAAGVMSGRGAQGLLNLDRDACNAMFDPKLRGARVLESVFAGREPAFCLLASSLSTVLGGLNHGAYASANACLDALAGEADHGSGLPWVCVNWDGWSADGVDGPQGSAAARMEMSMSEGVETFRRIMAMRGTPRLVISTADLDARLAQWVTIGGEEDAPGQVDDDGGQSGYERPDLAEEYVAPRDELEEKVAAIWGRLLGISGVGVHDNFLDLGGHSLLATQMLARLRSELQVDLTLEQVFERPTVAELVEFIRQQGSAEGQEDDLEELMRRVDELTPEEHRALLEQARRARGDEG